MSSAKPSPSRSLYYWPVRLGAFLLVALFIYRVWLSPRETQGSELQKYSIVPPFAFTERSGKTITNADLQGKIWVADFIYTTCPGPCPLVTASMAQVQKAVEHDPHVQLVTFTVDPEDDTPPVLAAYANKFDADPDRWWFLTGPKKPLYHLIGDGFHLAAVDNRVQGTQDQFAVTHSTQMALVDASGDVRGYYDGVGAEGRAALLQSIKTLEAEEKE